MPRSDYLKWIARRKALGLCIACDRKALLGRAYCQDCTNKRNRRKKEGRRDRLKLGLCGRCPRPREPGLTLCRLCLTRTGKETAARALANPFQSRLTEANSCARKVGHRECTASVEELEAAWKGSCDICSLPLVLTNRGKGNSKGVAHLEHCHSTGLFRGWVCNLCNIGLSRFQDSPDLLQKAIDYLKRAQQKIQEQANMPYNHLFVDMEIT